MGVVFNQAFLKYNCLLQHFRREILTNVNLLDEDLL